MRFRQASITNSDTACLNCCIYCENLESLNLDILSRFKNLKVISVDRSEADNWTDELKVLKDEKIQILLNDIYKY